MNPGFPVTFILTERQTTILRILTDAGLPKGAGVPAQGLAMLLDGALSAANTEQDLVDLLSWGSGKPRESLRSVAQSIMALYVPPPVPEFSNPRVLAALNALRRDLVATGLVDRVAWVDLAAANAAQLVEDPVDLVTKVVEDVQQRLQDEFVDTTWPACARHPNHPLEYSEGAWHCPRGGVIARLGELGSAPQQERE